MENSYSASLPYRGSLLFSSSPQFPLSLEVLTPSSDSSGPNKTKAFSLSCCWAEGSRVYPQRKSYKYMDFTQCSYLLSKVQYPPVSGCSLSLSIAFKQLFFAFFLVLVYYKLLSVSSSLSLSASLNISLSHPPALPPSISSSLSHCLYLSLLAGRTWPQRRPW